jgi:hypothetical protein
MIISGSAHAASEDEQWPIPNEYAFGNHSVLIQDNDSNGTAFSMLTLTDGVNNWICSSMSDPKCAKATGGYYRAMLPMCSSDSDMDCIVSLEAINPSGQVLPGKFVEYTYANAHPTEFKGDGVYTPLHASDPSIWSIPGAEHGFGNEYGVIVGLTNGIQVGSPRYENTGFFMNIYPISRMNTDYAVPDMNGFSNYPKCIQKVDSSGLSSLGCGGGAQEFGRYRCALKMISNATCLLQHAFPTNFRFRIVTRLSHEPAGMFHGRLADPVISIAPEDKATRVSVEAGSVRVPILYSGDDYNKLPVELQNYWNQCIGSGSCRGSSRQAQGNDWADPLHRNIQDYAQPYGDRSLKLIETFSKSTKDTSVAAPSSWNIRTLGPDQMQSATACFKSGKGFIGVVSTNSTTYSEGPPSFAGGELNYKVASLHYLSTGEVFKGSYNLILRSDVARCLYGFSNAPISANISILSADGQAQVATTVVNEKNNWLYLSANGFQFSQPTIKVALTQEGQRIEPAPEMTTAAAPSAKRKSTITCAKGKLKKKVSGFNPKCPSGYKKVA